MYSLGYKVNKNTVNQDFLFQALSHFIIVDEFYADMLAGRVLSL
ncbi:hypothetical protein NIASO_04695 [Niabella soli DSM 19437]|uniref:Uncharacterized protein n=1 Tax=Niabella soli DSM 19437 TaxID=929713 RepID=W0F2L4_9BACT|nr:hypothetical protein NIASO_04695 [Niabella soli DSM 19437]